jgi:hypothetical protein
VGYRRTDRGGRPASVGEDGADHRLSLLIVSTNTNN